MSHPPGSGLRPDDGGAREGGPGQVPLEQLEKGEDNCLRVSEAFYSCLGCHACAHVYPAEVNPGRVSELGRRVVASGPSRLLNQRQPVATLIVEATKRYKNPLGVREQCARWADGIEFDEDSETLLYTGNMYQLMAYNSRLVSLAHLAGKQVLGLAARFATDHLGTLVLSRCAADRRPEREVSYYLRNICFLLKASGFRFNYLRAEEPYPGTLIHEFGYEKEFIEYGAEVTESAEEEGD